MSQYECYLATSNFNGTDWASTVVYGSPGTEIKQPLKEGIEMKNLYEVFLVYGEDRINPLIHRTADAGYVVAENDEDAKIKSGIFSMIKSEWDADYLTIIVRNLGAVKIKEKAKEVKNV